MRLAPLVLVACSGPLADPPLATLEALGSTPCASDDDCLVSHNACYADATCSHEDDIPITPDVLCDPPQFTRPDADACVCGDAGTCAVAGP